MSDEITRGRKLAFVIEQLNAASVRKDHGSYSFLLCPFHQENTPSCRVFHSSTTRSPGYFKCMGCGASGNWDMLAPKLGLKSYEGSKPAVEYASLSLNIDLS